MKNKIKVYEAPKMKMLAIDLELGNAGTTDTEDSNPTTSIQSCSNTSYLRKLITKFKPLKLSHSLIIQESRC